MIRFYQKWSGYSLKNSQTLTQLLNNAFKQNIFPDDVKRAEVTPIVKKKDNMIKRIIDQ